MAAALALSQRAVGRTGTNPPVGCVIVSDGRIVGRGWTGNGGRPHAEAMALAQAGGQATGATVYVTLEPCAHQSERGPACAKLLASSRPARVVIAVLDPDKRTAGSGAAILSDNEIAIQTGTLGSEARSVMAGFFCRMLNGRPLVTVKIAASLDGCIATANGQSRWITGNAARAHTHLERARSDAILVGSATVRADNPALDVRIAGLEDQHTRRVMLGSSDAPVGWEVIRQPEDIAALDCNNLLVEGGAKTAASFIRAGLADRLLLYRAPILVGGGLPWLADIGLTDLADAHGQWQLQASRMFGNDRLEVFIKAPHTGR
jgi:diaminohydroxyphosphoribosylaminopyrimidine deaminase/5-amino-6-(5-phosphoribosylamino)uracil reductase